MSNLLKLTPENYYTKEANMQYVSVSQYKEFNGTTGKMGCEAYAMAKLRGEVEEVTTTALMVGSYVDAYFEGTLPTFSAQHPEIFSSRGKTAGELKSEYKQASIMIDRAVKDPVFMQYMAGDKQVIMTGEIEGVPVKIKIDSADGRRITDLKTVKSITETLYAKDLGQRLNFCEWWGYDLQAAVYREIYRQNTGDKGQILMDYRLAKNHKRQIPILADLNVCDTQTIVEILEEGGYKRIDDEEMIRTMLSKCLDAEGFLVYAAESAKKALELMSVTPDIILLDINMPEMDGLELCQFIRKHISCPIVFLTARVTEQDLINGLSVGGDDYITKPFSVDELLARISAHLRREERKSTVSNLKFNNELIIDYNSRTVFWGKEQLEFSNKEFEIIQFLSQNAGIVFDRETIYEKLWGYDGEGDSIVIKEHIRKIRNKLSIYTDKNYIETVWGVGYKWIK